MARSHQKLEQERKDASLEASEERGPADTFMVDSCWPCKLGENQLQLFYTIPFVVTHYSNPGN